MIINGVELISVNDGFFGLDGGAMFGVVPKPLWHKAAPADDRNRIRLGTNALLVREAGRVVLVDCGIGDRWDEKGADIYKIEKPDGGLVQDLGRWGLAPGDITDQVVSHQHFDHQGGATVRQDGRVRPTFPSAVYHYQRRQMAWARTPTAKDRGSYRPDDFEPVVGCGQALIHQGDYALTPSVWVEQSHGHTPGLQLVHVQTGSFHLVYCADLIPLAPHVRLPYIMGYDVQPLVTLEEKQSLLARAAREGWYLYLEHDPQWVAVTVEATGDDFAVSARLGREAFNAPASQQVV